MQVYGDNANKNPFEQWDIKRAWFRVFLFLHGAAGLTYHCCRHDDTTECGGDEGGAAVEKKIAGRTHTVQQVKTRCLKDESQTSTEE